MSERSPKELAIAWLDGEELTSEQITIICEHIAGKTHLEWEGGSACKGIAGAPARTTRDLRQVTCDQCKRSAGWQIVRAALGGAYSAYTDVPGPTPKPKSAKAPLPRGRCQSCKGRYPLRGDGTVQRHTVAVNAERNTFKQCDGVGYPPLEK